VIKPGNITICFFDFTANLLRKPGLYRAECPALHHLEPSVD
jgi:hypothetical protein